MKRGHPDKPRAYTSLVSLTTSIQEGRAEVWHYPSGSWRTVHVDNFIEIDVFHVVVLARTTSVTYCSQLWRQIHERDAVAYPRLIFPFHRDIYLPHEFPIFPCVVRRTPETLQRIGNMPYELTIIAYTCVRVPHTVLNVISLTHQPGPSPPPIARNFLPAVAHR